MFLVFRFVLALLSEWLLWEESLGMLGHPVAVKGNNRSLYSRVAIVHTMRSG